MVIFTDIRGFTKWSDDIEAFQFIEEFINDFYALLDGNFSGSYIKKLGDGAMIVATIKPDLTKDDISQLLKTNLSKIKAVETAFTNLCDNFFQLHGYRTRLRLGWGIVRGVVKRLDGDYIGSNINKCSRLCSIARPFGIVVEKDDFSLLPPDIPYTFTSQARKFPGLVEQVNVWVTDEIATQFVPREHRRETPEVHVAGLCLMVEEGRLLSLLGRRNPDRELYPGLIEGCGGQLSHSESFAEGVKRHFRQEMNLTVEVLTEHHLLYDIREANQPLIPGIRFLCLYRGGIPDSKNHTEIWWASKEELEAIPAQEFIPGLKDEFLELLAAYERSKS